MPHPTALSDAPVLAHHVRNGVVESVHRAIAVVTAPDGSVLHAWGQPGATIFPRSANKPLQAVGILRTGLTLPPDHLALACSSHNGEPIHRETALAILHAAGLDESDLLNTPDHPVHEPSRDDWIRAGHDKASLAQNCSGKHAAMLAASARGGWPVARYLETDHPVQVSVTGAIEDLGSTRVATMAVDGCGAPLHGIPLGSLALAFGRIAAGSEGSEQALVRDAIRAHPYLVGGAGRSVTTLVQEVDGLVAKDGAEGVYAVGLADGRGIAIKTADGAKRAKGPILAAILRRLGVGTDAAVAALEDEPVLGHGQPVGSVVAVGI